MTDRDTYTVAVQGVVTYTVEVPAGIPWREAAAVAAAALGDLQVTHPDGDEQPGDLDWNPDAFDGIVLVDGEAVDR